MTATPDEYLAALAVWLSYLRGGNVDVVINKCFGGFGLSKKAIERLKELGVENAEDYSYRYEPQDRADPMLVQVVRELGGEASGPYASLQIVTIPDGVDYYIDDYDGMEQVNETHRSWG